VKFRRPIDQKRETSAREGNENWSLTLWLRFSTILARDCSLVRPRILVNVRNRQWVREGGSGPLLECLPFHSYSLASQQLVVVIGVILCHSLWLSIKLSVTVWLHYRQWCCKVCHDCITFCRNYTEKCGKPRPCHTYIRSIRGHNPGHSATYGAWPCIVLP